MSGTVTIDSKLASDMVFLLDHYGQVLNHYDGGGRVRIKLPPDLEKFRRDPIPWEPSSPRQVEIDDACIVLISAVARSKARAFTRMVRDGNGVPRGLMLCAACDPAELSNLIVAIRAAFVHAGMEPAAEGGAS